MASKEGYEEKPSVFVRAWRGYERGLTRFVSWVAEGYGGLGAFTARRPWTVIIISIVLSLLVCVGWLRFRIENDADVLWVPQTGKARDDGDFVDAYYPKSAEGASFYAQLKPSLSAQFGGNNALQIPVTWEMFQLHNKIMNITVTYNGKQVGFETVCYKKKSGGCDLAGGYLWYWENSFDYFIGNISGSYSDPAVGNVTAFKQQVSNTTYPDGQPVSLLSVFGGTTFQYNPFQLASAQVIAQGYSLDDSLPADVVKEWNDAFTDLMKAQQPQQQYQTYTWITGSSVGEELGKAINGDMFLVIISLLIFIVLAIIVLSKLDLVKTRTVLAVLGVFVTALGIMSGWGWGMIFGMPFTPLQQLSPFILLGMGVDVIFILVKSFDIITQRQPWLPLPEAFRRLMSTAGLSVQVTLLCSAVAFALGAVDELASVKWFSAFACLNTLMIMILMMTAFIGFMVLTEKRIAARRMDFCCCWKRGPAPPSPAGSGGSADGNAPPMAIVMARPVDPSTGMPVPGPSGKGADAQVTLDAHGNHVISDDDIKDENFVKKFFRKYYAPLLARWWFKVLVVACFLAYAGVSAYGITQLKYGQPLSDLAPDGSYVQDYDAVQQATYAQQVGVPTGVYYREIDVSLPSVQYKMLKSWDMTLMNGFVNSSTSAFLDNWLVDFLDWAQKRNATVVSSPNCYNPLIGKVTGNLAGVITPVAITGCVPQASFYSLLDQWMGGKVNRSSIIRRQDAQGTIFTSKFSVLLRAPGDDDKYSANMIDSIRETDSEINSQLWAQENAAAGDNCVFIYNGQFLFAEGDAILPEAALLYFMLALVGVFVVTTFMLVNPLASIMMMIAVGMVVLFLFGELYIGGIRFNQVSIINMIMATGLSVDYAVYFAQKFMTSPGVDGNDRMKTALVDTGFAVFLGGIVALLGTIPMAFSKSVIIRTFFFLIFFTVIFALLVGLMLMPVVFSVLAPLVPPVKSALVAGGGAGAGGSGRFDEGLASPGALGPRPQSAAEDGKQKQVQLPPV